MLLEPISNQTAIRIYYGLWEIFIGFGSFIIFFGIFIKFYFNAFEEYLLSGYIKSSISFYKPILNIFNQINLFERFKYEYLEENNFNKTLENEDKNIKEYNKEYDNLLIKIIIGILIAFLVLLFIPVFIGLIPFREINFIYLGISFLLHIVLIIIFEIALLYYIIPINNPIELHKLFDNII